MSRYNVLVDSSVWIDYFKSGGIPKLDRLIEEDLVCINEIIFTELSPPSIKQGEEDILNGLRAIKKMSLFSFSKHFKLMNNHLNSNFFRNTHFRFSISSVNIFTQIIR